MVPIVRPQVAHWIAMFAGYAIVLAGLALIASGWREVYYAHREGRLATGGPYSLVRHPQYTGIFIAIFGEGIVHWPTVVSVAMFPIIVAAYVLLARREERQMLEQFGDRYREYQRRVSMFFPHWRDLRQQVSSRSI